jgi:predicted N-acetyltransferase YhbS
MSVPTIVSSQHVFFVEPERASDAEAREHLLDRAMGPARKRKSSEKLRGGMQPSAGLALVSRDKTGGLIGSVRLWNIAAGDTALLLLGPLAVDQALAGCGVGSALMQEAITRASRANHGAIILVGDPAYYHRFGFRAEKTVGLKMPGPVERHRLLGLELKPGYLAGAAGLLKAQTPGMPQQTQVNPALLEQAA